MRLESIETQNWLCHRQREVACSPLTVIAGPNESGKSAIADAVAFTLLADLRRVESKGDRDQLITWGAASGWTALQFAAPVQGGDPVTISRNIADGKLTSCGSALTGGEATAAVPYLLDPARFANATDDQRRTLLLQIGGGALDRAALFSALREPARKLDPALIDALEKCGSDDAEGLGKFAATKATESRGAWKAHTSETYGAKKAVGWAAATAAAPALADVTDAEAHERATAAKVQAVTLRLGAARARATDTTARRAELTAKAARAADLELVIGSQTGMQQVCQQHVGMARTALERIKARAAGATALECPHCGGKVVTKDGGGLGPYQPTSRPASQADIDAAQRDLENADEELASVSGELAASQDDLKVARQAAVDLAALPYAGAPAEGRPADQAEDVEALLAAARTAHDQAKAKVLALQAKTQAAARGAERTAGATRAHQEVVGWTAIAEALAPSGIAAERLAAALAPINITLAELAGGARWRAVSIGLDLAISIEGKSYGLFSESAKWRADTLIALALSKHSAVRFVVLDRFDVLGTAYRGAALSWLYKLAKVGDVAETIILIGTLTERPTAPADVSVVWLGPDQQPQKKAA